MKPATHITRNLFFIALALISWYFIIGARLIYLQVISGQLLLNQSQKNFLRHESIPSMRGTIRDRIGIELATNRPCTNIYWQGTGNSQLHDHQRNTLLKVESILGIPISSDISTLKTLHCIERQRKKFLLAEDITYEQLSQIAEVTAQEKNIVITTTFKRYYPCGTMACHLLGYLGRMDMHFYGKMGLESLFEDTLKGHNGTKLKTINSVGTSLSESEIEKALNGADLNLTIDYNLQQIAESTFPEDYSGTLIIMDPEDGSLYALVSRPDFDPAIFLQPIERSQWLQLQEKKPFLNRAFNACYPPGSLFKLVTLAAALEKEIIHEEDSVHCIGFVEFCKRKYRCNNRWGHGTLSIDQALAHSCNTLFYDIGKKISIDTLAHYAFQFGLGKKTSLLFAQKEGLIPTNEWKKQTKGERWWPGETLSATIGQSYILVTPIQIASMIASIFTGTVPEPRILHIDPVTKSPLDMSTKTRDFLQKSMELVVQSGTGRRIRHVDDFKIYAKTSTAQTSSLDKRKLGDAYKEHGWFTAYFHYKDNKPLVIVCLVEHAGSSRIPADCARAFFKEYRTVIDRNQLLL